jgi:xylulose-5-phosphate/fructose-6-phosphate phosphoketolase
MGTLPGIDPDRGGRKVAVTDQLSDTEITDVELDALDAYWRAANYLTVGQIYLQANPLLREPLLAAHIKPRLLGHWGTSPGLNLLYVHLNRVIRHRDLDLMFVCGPGHGGPAIVANVYLEGTYSEVYPEVTMDAHGLRRLFRQFSTPGGIPSHVSVPTPGSIHEGGELGYALVHAAGAAFDAPERIVACVIGDGEAETGPLAGSWKSIKFLNPVRDGAVLPILHLNDGKISGPTILGRTPDDEVAALLRGEGYTPRFVEGDDPTEVHRALSTTLDEIFADIAQRRAEARASGDGTFRSGWPALVLRTPKGWTGPAEVDGIPIEGTFRSHQVPVANVREDSEHLAILDQWLRSYRPEELFDEAGRPVPALLAQAPTGERRMGANPAANGGRLRVALDLPDHTDYALDVPTPGAFRAEATKVLGEWLRDVFSANAAEANFRLFCPDETNSNRLTPVFDVENRCWTLPVHEGRDDHLAPDGRVMEVLSEHLCHGWLEGYTLTGRHGLFATYEAFAMVSASMTVQHGKWLDGARELGWRRPVSSLNVLLTSTCWRNDHNGFSHQGPGLIDTVVSKKPSVSRVYLPPDANCLLSVADHCLRSTDYVNLIVVDKQPHLQWLDAKAAREHCSRGYGRWHWAETAGGEDPDVVLASAGDVVTMEAVAAAELLREHVPEMRLRFVNVVDIMTLLPANDHPHGMDQLAFSDLFTPDRDVIFAFHGYPREVHFLVHGQGDTDRFHVRGYEEEGTTTTPFDMVVLNRVSRYHLCLEAIRRARVQRPGMDELADHCRTMLARHAIYIAEHLEDMPEVRNWTRA